MTARFASALLALAALGADPGTAATLSGSGLPISDATLHRQWTASWLACPAAPQRDPGVFRFRKVLDLGEVPGSYVVHASGDQRFVLFVNGRRVGIGPSRGDLSYWRFETFDLAPFLKPGPNALVALVWSFGTQAPAAQVTDRTGFVLQGDGEAEKPANTDATWQCAPEPGHEPWPEGIRELRARHYLVVGPGERLDAAQYDWSWSEVPAPGAPAGRWQPAVAYDRPSPRSISEGPGYALTPEGRLLVPDELPPMEYRLVPAGSVVRASGVSTPVQFPDAASVTVPARTRAQILLDRRELVAAYPELAFSGGRGARVRLTYQEALVGDGFRKGNRDEITGKRMLGYSDEIVPDGGKGRVFHSLWWRTWRFLQLDVETGAEPLVLESLRAHATGYPFEAKGRVDAKDPVVDRIMETGWRTARLCAHETYMDCPYYEQMQYVGDTRIQALVSYAMSGDDRLARQAISAFDRSRLAEGLTSSRTPGVVQFIPPFSLLWVGMVHDFWRYRDDPTFVRAQLPGTRTVLDWFLARQRADGLLGSFAWWGFLDWATEFDGGVPPMEKDGQSAPLTLQLVNALSEAADLESALGDPHRATLYRERAAAARAGVMTRCWDEGRGLVADRPSRDRFSQQTNVLAILSDALPAERREAVLDKVLAAGMPSAREVEAKSGAARQGLTRASYYFRFYLSRALDKLGRGDEYLVQLEPWREMLQLGLSTWAESPFDDVRSDCHAWSAHPNYDLLTIVAGIRPASPGFRSVRIEPRLGGLTALDASFPHARGPITVSYHRTGGGLEASVTLPPGLAGSLVWRGRATPLHEGTQELRVE
ncbi:MAG: alpha-L-rhamnosidase C-terminal domain-containing protein [Vicinamibacteria bacterium]